MAYQLVTPSTLLPVSLDDAKGQLRILHDDDDAHITRLIKRAAAHIERHCGIVLCESAWRRSLDGFPASGGIVELRMPPVRSVTGVAYLDGDGDSVPVELAELEMDLVGAPARLRPSSGAWPSMTQRLGGVTIDFTAGNPESAETPGVAAIPEAAAMLVLLLVEQWYEAVDDRSSKSHETAIRSLMADLKWAPMAGFGA